MNIEEIYEAIDRLASRFDKEARAPETERRPTEALATMMREAKIPFSKVAKEMGGCELAPAQQIDFFARLSYLNPTAGWLAFNQSGVLGLMSATMSREGIDAILASTPCPLVAAVSAPTGRSQKVDGGYKVTGKWSYASGVTCSDFVFLMTIADDPPLPIGVAIPAPDVTLHDDWHVAALQGTGSVDVTVEDYFVPESMTASPLVQVRGGSQYARIGYRGYVGGENFGFSLGVAQRMLAEITKLAKTKKRIFDPTTVSERGAFQQELGRTDATFRAARAYLMDELDRAMSIADETAAALGPSDQARVEAAVAWSTEAVVQAAMRLFPYAGAGALHLSNPIQRTLRDVIGSGQHLVATNETLDTWGKALLESAD